MNPDPSPRVRGARRAFACLAVISLLYGCVRMVPPGEGPAPAPANALLAGGTDTPAAGSDENKVWAAQLHPVRRIAQPQEIANAALFLLSDLSSFVIGSNLWADGGNSATKVHATV